eukprot:1921792-Rhodomonas_salina.1
MERTRKGAKPGHLLQILARVCADVPFSLHVHAVAVVAVHSLHHPDRPPKHPAAPPLDLHN